MLKAQPGTYALILRLDHPASVRIGKLGHLRLARGFYIYLGSALGLGGLRARVAHHQREAKRPHWHIDYLRAFTRLERVWFCYDAQRREHEWAALLPGVETIAKAVAGFGASDCTCASHLYFLRHRPSLPRFLYGLRALDPSHPPLEEIKPTGRKALIVML
jgi:Uri superfamily endonuclease